METLAAQPQNFEAYRLVDDIPEVAEQRQAVRQQAESILAARRQSVESGEQLDLIPVDALSTGRGVWEAEKTYGFDSPERAERWDGLVLDCRRLVGEWYRKLKPEYFEPVRHTFNEHEQAFYSHGLSIQQMTENALVPIAEDPEEEQRRINERVEDATLQIVHGLGVLAVGEAVRTVSETTESARISYADDMRNGRKHRGYRGYVPEIDKYVVRDARIDPETGDRLVEQLAVPGVYITHEIFQEALRRRGADTSGMGRTELHGAQIIASDDLMEFQALLDEVASEQWCANIFMGEEVAPDYEKNYDTFRQEALARQESLQDLAETTATFIMDLVASNFDRREAPEHVEEFVKMLLLDLGKESKAVAAQIFGEETAEGLQEVARLEALGEYDRAYELMEEVRKNAPGGGSCGAGSCGLEALTHDEEKSLREKMNATDKDKLVRDKERACPNCGKKSVVYAYSDSKVTKACEKCEFSETKHTKTK